MYYMGFTWQDAYNLPVNYRRWLLERLLKEMQGKDASSEPDIDAPITKSKAPHHNTDELRALQGRSRHQVPPRLIRFT